MRRRSKHPEADLGLGALLPSFFWVSQGASFAFPEKVPRVMGVWVNERFSSTLMLALIGLGYALERRRGA